MKKNIFSWVLVICCHHYLDAQKLGSRIKDSEAKKRVNKYVYHKKPALDSLIHVTEIDSIRYSAGTFVNLLEKMAAVQDYDGFRIYFATYPDKPVPNGIDSGDAYVTKPADVTKTYYNKFTLIFVPTKPGSKPGYHNDQVQSCYIVVNDHVELRDANLPGNKYIISWIKKYREQRMKYLDKNGNGYINKGVLRSIPHQIPFYETESIWYSQHSMNAPDSGLLQYIKNADNNIKNVDATFAGYRHKSPGYDYSYQLTLVFELLDDKAIKILYVPKAPLSTFSLDGKVVSADTGRPCPPPSTGCPLIGATLPNQ